MVEVGVIVECFESWRESLDFFFCSSRENSYLVVKLEFGLEEYEELDRRVVYFKYIELFR